VPGEAAKVCHRAGGKSSISFDDYRNQVLRVCDGGAVFVDFELSGVHTPSASPIPLLRLDRL